jgi:hypothetical protein
MTKYHNVGISRTTGIEYTTSVIEAIGVEHKETTRYEVLILAWGSFYLKSQTNFNFLLFVFNKEITIS